MPSYVMKNGFVDIVVTLNWLYCHSFVHRELTFIRSVVIYIVVVMLFYDVQCSIASRWTSSDARKGCLSDGHEYGL